MTDLTSGPSKLSTTKQSLLSQRLRQRATAPSIPRRPAETVPPLSFAQERLWFMEQFAPGSAAHTIPVAMRLHGPLDAEAFGRALRRLAERHETLRMSYPADADDRPVIRVHSSAEVPLRVADAESLAAAQDLVGELIAESFDIERGPVARALLVRLAEDDHVLALAVHHIACDGWSVDVLLSDLFVLYEADQADVPSALPARSIDYGDYAIWQRDAPTHDADHTYWAAQLAALPTLDLVTDRIRPPEQTYNGAAHSFSLDQTLTAALKDLADQTNATPYMVLLAAFQTLLAKYTSQDDFAVGTPVAGRPLTELEPLVGCFVNMLTMRADLAGRPSFADVLARVRETAAAAYDHQGLPFEQLVQRLDLVRDVARPPLFQVIFAMQNYRRESVPVGSATLTAEPFPLTSWATRYDLELYITEQDSALNGLFVYNTDLFEPETVARLATHLRVLLTAALADPSRAIADLEILDAAERAELLVDFNDTAADFPEHTTLHALVESQAAHTPEAIAVVFENSSLTYRELNAQADALAHRLTHLGVGPESLVAVCAERSLALPVALLGVLKSGAAYLPLDPEYPPDRLAFMLTDASAAALLTQRGLLAQVPETTAPVVLLDDLHDWPPAPTESPGTPSPPGDLAYAIYTSGSTGRPKGVLNTHRGIVNRLNWMQRRYRLTPDDVVLQKTPAGFDVSVWEFFWPLLAGARLVLAKPGGHKDAAYLRDLIQSAGVTTAHFVPSMLGVFLAEDGADRCRGLRRILCSGEELPVDLALRCLAALPAELHNLYGPTEAAIDVSAWQCTPQELIGAARVPIGGPIQNLALHVLDPDLRPVPIGVPGELFLGGVGLARGYLHRPGLTAERFVPDPYGPPGSRLYRTGDLVRRRSDGVVEFLGRIDGQVKIRGLRIELGEIEVVLREQPGVAEAAAVVREDVPGDRRIVAYVVGDADPAGLRTALKRRLPDYMVPSALVGLDALPLSPNGKLDRRALPEPQRGRDEGTEYTAPETESQQLIAAIWTDVLRVERIGIDDDFFDLGGHSLLAAQAVAKIRRTAGAGVSVLDFFKNPTVRALATLLDIPAAERGPAELVHELTKPVPVGQRTLSFVCVPYGGGSAVVYQPLADALPAGHRLFAVAIPGHDIGLDEDALPFDDLATRCVDEILRKVDGPLAVYGHCGVGSALAVEIARRLEAAGRRLEALYIGAIFPFARPENGLLSGLSRMARLERFRSDRGYANWLLSMGVDMSDIEPEQATHIIQNMRKDSQSAEDYYTGLLRDSVDRLEAPVITVAGDRDPTTEFYAERYREWHFLTDTSAAVVLDEAGHFFLKYRAEELASIITKTTPALEAPEPLSRTARGEDAGWWLHGVSRSAERVVPTGPVPSMRRFLAVASGQLVSMTGSALTEFAVPLWIYLHTGSLLRFALFAVCGLVPGMLAAPLAGAVVDRSNRRRVMLFGDAAAGGTQLILGLLLWTGHLQVWHIYPLLICLSVSLTFQRLAYGSSVAQLVPKHYLGHANGVVQMINGVAQIMVPLVAVGLMAAIGLGGILVIDVASYAFAVTVVLLVRFPATMAWRRKETLLAEIAEGLRYSWGQPGLRAMLLFFAVLNVFLSPLFLLISPLVLSFTTLSQVGEVALVAGIGATLGGLTMTFWGGPRRLRMRGMLLCTLALASFCLVTGLRPTLWLIAVGAFGMSFWLTVVNGIYTTIVQVKVAQRFHGRVFALNTLIAWSTLPIGWGLVVPYGTKLFEPLMAPGGALAGSFGPVLGTGHGRGIGLMYVAFAVAMTLVVVVALRTPALRRFDADVPDAAPDDLIGLEARQRLVATGSVR
ncbi:amino acid adenylation domain-containing protein [Catenulispora yoronensis]|uniref:non-ribosomal peptide synthetase/MFS transporter n=1 Tax=Catenulispora yoronensis TaxID=450799 RepID=UPI0031D8D5C0